MGVRGIGYSGYMDMAQAQRDHHHDLQERAWQAQFDREQREIDRKRLEKEAEQNAKDDALVAKIMAAMDAKYGHLLDRSDLNQIIKETKCDN